MIERLKQRIEVYALILLIGAGAAKFFRDSESETKLLRGELGSIQSEGVARDTASDEMISLQLGNIAEDVDELKEELEVTRSDVRGMNVTIVGGAVEHAQLLNGKMVALQHQVANARRTQGALGDSLASLKAEVRMIAETPPDTVVVVLTDTLEVQKKKWWKRAIPGL